jgi:hypothetical protein
MSVYPESYRVIWFMVYVFFGQPFFNWMLLTGTLETIIKGGNGSMQSVFFCIQQMTTMTV